MWKIYNNLIYIFTSILLLLISSVVMVDGKRIIRSSRGRYLFETALKSALPEQLDSELVFPHQIVNHPSVANNVEGQICIGVETSQHGQLIFLVKKVGQNSPATVIVKHESGNFQPVVDAKNLMTLQKEYLYEGSLKAMLQGKLEIYPVSLIFHSGKMHTIFNIDDHQFAIYPVWNETQNVSNHRESHTTFSTYPHYFIKYRLENSSILVTKDSPDASEIVSPEVSPIGTLTNQKLNQTQEHDDDVLKVPHLIEGVLFIDESDLKNISEETIALIGEKITRYFDILAERVNIRFKLVDWFPYPAHLVVENDMIGCQRRLEKHMTKHKERDTFDVGMMISTRAIEKIKNGYIVGWANVGSMCKRTHSALISWYKPTSVAHFLAHELTHLLNSYHDEEKECEPGSQLDDQPKMDPKHLVRWSNCTVKIISERVKSRKLDCLLIENFKRNATSA